MSAQTVASPPVARRAHPALAGPGKKASDVLNWLSAMERDSAGAARALDEHAVTVYRGILRAKALPFGLNRVVAAQRQRRNILRMARAYEHAAQLARASKLQWKTTFAEGDVAKVRTTGFDMSK
jgi:hypothetical protein